MSAYIFIDAENVKPEIGFTAVEKFSYEYFVEQVEIIGNESNISSKYLEAGDQYQVKNCFFGKNSADTWLCTEIAKTIFEKPEVDIIIIVSSDRDFLAAVKLVTDKKKKIIFVSDGNGHKNLKALLYDLRINPDLIELVDFKNLTVNIPEPEKKKGAEDFMEIFSPNPNVNKIREICKMKLSLPMQNFFLKNEAKFQFISVNHEDKLFEVPFFDGINISTFRNILIELKIANKAETAKKIIAENSFKIENNNVFIVKDIKPSENKQPPFNDVINYFTAHAAETKNIFIKCGENLQEIPFVNGISLGMFSRLLKGYEIADDTEKIKKIIADSFLNLRENKIYLHSEENISDALNIDFQKLSAQSLDFLKSNEGKIEFFAVIQGNNQFKIPFVEGIPANIFSSMLKELKVLGKNAKVQKFLSNNNFSVENNLVYKSK